MEPELVEKNRGKRKRIEAGGKRDARIVGNEQVKIALLYFYAVFTIKTFKRIGIAVGRTSMLNLEFAQFGSNFAGRNDQKLEFD